MKKQLQVQLSRINAARASLVGALSMVAASAHAALPADVETAISGAKADGATVGGLILAAIIVIFAFKLIRRAL